MPVIREDAVKSLEETDLRAADLKEEKEENPGTVQTSEKAAEEEAVKTEPKAESKAESKEEDPNVIELDQVQEEETEKSEELESDYEEK